MNTPIIQEIAHGGPVTIHEAPIILGFAVFDVAHVHIIGIYKQALLNSE